MSNSPEQLYASLRNLHYELQKKQTAQWNRSLPFEETLFDRWERAKSLGFGEKSSIYQSSCVYGSVSVGKETWVGPFTILDGAGGLTIGSTCSISAGVQIYSHDSVQWALSGGLAPYDRAAVVIEDCCYVGAQSIIGKGVTIGHHSVIGANSFVSKSLPPYSIAGGTPARIIGQVRITPSGEISLHYE